MNSNDIYSDKSHEPNGESLHSGSPVPSPRYTRDMMLMNGGQGGFEMYAQQVVEESKSKVSKVVSPRSKK